MGDLMKQKTIALNLYRQFSKNNYYFWAIISLSLQTIFSSSDKESSTVLLLAEKMCEKFFKEKKLSTMAEFEIYLGILKKLEKYDSILELIATIENRKLYDDTFNYQLHDKLKALHEQNHSDEAFNGFKKLITDNNDQYDYFLEAYAVAKNLDEKTCEKESISTTKSYLKEFIDFIEDICSKKRTFIWKWKNEESMQNGNGSQESIELSNDCIQKESQNSFEDDNISSRLIKKRCPRGPFIARIVVYSRLKKFIEQKHNHVIFDSLRDHLNKIEITKLIAEYFESFSTYYVCARDIQFIIESINLSTDEVC